MPVDRNPAITFTTGELGQRHLAESLFLTEADSLQQQHGLSEIEALGEAARLDPHAYRRYREFSTGYLTEPTTTNATQQFTDAVDGLVRISGITYGEAYEKAAEMNPELYAQYRAEWANV
jgi:hypothetical protein